MEYYAIVNKIKEEQKSGIYGRVEMKEEDYELFVPDSLKFNITDKLSLDFGNVAESVNKTASSIINSFKGFGRRDEIKIQKKIKSNSKMLIFHSNLLKDDYEIDKEFTYGVLDKFSNKERKNLLEDIFKSKGGSSLIVLERDNLPDDLMHYAGENGSFSEGIYVTHPKHSKLLMPLDNLSELVQSLILEETIRAYEALGAKKITIEDVTELKLDTGGRHMPTKISVKEHIHYDKKILRTKQFGKGTFDPKRALKNKYFITDIPAVMSTIEGRVEGNQTLEEFKETINLNMGVDLKILTKFHIESNFSYKRIWHFKVDFYDKTEMETR